MKTLLLLMLMMLAMLTESYILPVKRVDMRGFSLYDLEDIYMENEKEKEKEEAARHHYIHPKPHITAFYPLYDFGRRRRR